MVESDLYRVEFSNHGAVVKSWQLKKYTDDSKPARVLDLVHPDAAQQTGGWPLAVALNDEQQESAANTGLYQISIARRALCMRRPMRNSVGATATWKSPSDFHFDRSYVVRVETSVKFNGAPILAGRCWLGGFGDLTVLNPSPIDTVSSFPQ